MQRNPETLIFFPRWRGLDGFPAAEAEGTLIERAGCLFLRWESGTADLLLWPPDARPVDAGGSVAVADGSGRIRAAVGQHVRFGGGQYGPEHRSFVEQRLIGMAVPEPCAGTYWLVSPD